MSEVKASILIPTHNHHLTLPIAVDSALRQSIREIEVIIIGDGVTDETRMVAQNLAGSDSRVRFLDFPKGENHGETYRDEAVKEANSEFIFYLCDDDLLMPNHISNLLELLEVNDLVHSKNGYFTISGKLNLFPTDLAIKGAIDWHLKLPNRNHVSLTGTAHRRATYLSLESRWTATPAGEWPDHFMWKKFFRKPGLVAATHSEMTALQFPTSEGRENMNQEQRVAELLKWREFLNQPNGREILRYLVFRSTLETLNSFLFKKRAVTATNPLAASLPGIRKGSIQDRFGRFAYQVLARIIIRFNLT